VKPTAFPDGAGFGAWLARLGARETELLVRLFKVHAKHRGMTYRDALDQALCHGWIDGVRRSLDADSFTIRFSPRQPRSIWSAVNIRRASELEAEGRMTPAGLAAFRARSDARSRVYAYEQRPEALDPASRKVFRANPRAWAYYQSTPPWYQRTTAHWVLSAKRAETRERRLATLIDCSARSTTLPQLTRPTGAVEAAARRPARGRATPGRARAASRARERGGVLDARPARRSGAGSPAPSRPASRRTGS